MTPAGRIQKYIVKYLAKDKGKSMTVSQFAKIWNEARKGKTSFEVVDKIRALKDKI